MAHFTHILQYFESLRLIFLIQSCAAKLSVYTPPYDLLYTEFTLYMSLCPLYLPPSPSSPSVSLQTVISLIGFGNTAATALSFGEGRHICCCYHCVYGS